MHRGRIAATALGAWGASQLLLGSSYWTWVPAIVAVAALARLFFLRGAHRSVGQVLLAALLILLLSLPLISVTGRLCSDMLSPESADGCHGNPRALVPLGLVAMAGRSWNYGLEMEYTRWVAPPWAVIVGALAFIGALVLAWGDPRKSAPDPPARAKIPLRRVELAIAPLLVPYTVATFAFGWTGNNIAAQADTAAAFESLAWREPVTKILLLATLAAFGTLAFVLARKGRPGASFATGALAAALATPLGIATASFLAGATHGIFSGVPAEALSNIFDRPLGVAFAGLAPVGVARCCEGVLRMRRPA